MQGTFEPFVWKKTTVYFEEQQDVFCKNIKKIDEFERHLQLYSRKTKGKSLAILLKKRSVLKFKFRISAEGLQAHMNKKSPAQGRAWHAPSRSLQKPGRGLEVSVFFGSCSGNEPFC